MGMGSGSVMGIGQELEWVRNWDKDGSVIGMGMGSGSAMEMGEELGWGWDQDLGWGQVRNWEKVGSGNGMRTASGSGMRMGEKLGWGWVRIQPQPWHDPGEDMEWHRPYLGVVELGGTGDGVDVCPHQRGDEADGGRIWRLFGLGGETAPPPLQAVGPDHCGWDLQ